MQFWRSFELREEGSDAKCDARASVEAWTTVLSRCLVTSNDDTVKDWWKLMHALLISYRCSPDVGDGMLNWKDYACDTRRNSNPSLQILTFGASPTMCHYCVRSLGLFRTTITRSMTGSMFWAAVYS